MRLLVTYTIFAVPIGFYSVHKNMEAVKTWKRDVNREDYTQMKYQAKLRGAYAGLVWPMTLYSIYKYGYVYQGFKKKNSKI